MCGVFSCRQRMRMRMRNGDPWDTMTGATHQNKVRHGNITSFHVCFIPYLSSIRRTHLVLERRVLARGFDTFRPPRVVTVSAVRDQHAHLERPVLSTRSRRRRVPCTPSQRWPITGGTSRSLIATPLIQLGSDLSGKGGKGKCESADVTAQALAHGKGKAHMLIQSLDLH